MTVAAFVERQLRPYDTTQLAAFDLCHDTGAKYYSGWCESNGTCVVSCGVNPGVVYPYTERFAVYHHETYADEPELMVCLAGHEAYHFLCATNQAEPDTELGANVMGVAWLEEWRA